MFKVLLLQAMHGLSDERCEYLIKDRLSFMRFLGLRLADPAFGSYRYWPERCCWSGGPAASVPSAPPPASRLPLNTLQPGICTGPVTEMPSSPSSLLNSSVESESVGLCTLKWYRITGAREPHSRTAYQWNFLPHSAALVLLRCYGLWYWSYFKCAKMRQP